MKIDVLSKIAKERQERQAPSLPEKLGYLWTRALIYLSFLKIAMAIFMAIFEDRLKVAMAIFEECR